MENIATMNQTSAIYRNNQQAPNMNRQYSSKAEAKEAAEQFEAFFVSQSLESMFSGIQTDSMFGGGHAEKIFRSMMIDEYGKSIAKSGGIGISDEVMKSLLNSQEVSSTTKTNSGEFK